MAVFRIDKTRDYTVMSNHHFRNTSLFLKAKGLLSLILSLPENWDYTLKGLSRICRDGVDSISAGVRELEQHGYLIRERVRNSNGQLGAIIYTILEQPRDAVPDSAEPIQENPTPDIPILESPMQEIPIQLNKHAWEFILDKDVLSYGTDYYILCHIAKLVNEGFYSDGGRIRGVPVTIGGTSYVPPLPIETIVKENIDAILQETGDPVDIAIKLCLYCMKTQIFNDGNKRASVIFANHYMISKGQGLIVIPEKYVSEFKRLLVAYYEDRDHGEILEFMRSTCWRTF